MSSEGTHTEDQEQNIKDEEKQENEEIETPPESTLTIRLEIGRVQFFVIKNDERNELSSGELKLISNAPDHNELVFTFPDYPEISHTLSQSELRPCIKMCDCDYVFMVDGMDSFGLYIDATQCLNPKEIFDEFETLIKEYCHFKVSSKMFPIHRYPINEELLVGPPDKIALAGMKLAVLICKGTVFSAKGIRKGTLMGTKAINKSKHYLKTKITPNEIPTKLNPKVQSRLAKAQIAGKAAVKVSGALLTGAIATANVLSNEVSDAVSKTKLGQKVAKKSGPKTKAAKEVVKSTVAGVYTIYDEVISSGLHLVQETSHATAEVVGHKYGDEVFRAAESTAEIVDSAASTVVNLNMLGYKSLAKRIAANSTVEILSEEQERQEHRNQQLSLNPIDAMKGFVIVNDLSNRLQQNKEESRKRRQEYVGIEGVVDSDENYKISRNLQSEHSNSVDLNSNEITDLVASVASVNRSNNFNYSANSNASPSSSFVDVQPSSIVASAAPISIFEQDDTLDVD